MKQITLFLLGVIISLSVTSCTNNTPSGASGPIDSSSTLIPVHVNVYSNKIQLSAGGQTIHFEGSLFRLDADASLETKWEIKEKNFAVLSLDIRAKTTTLLKRVHWFPGEWEPGTEQAVQSTKLIDNVLFLRKGNVSFFLSLDFPYSEINKEGITYPPNIHLMPGQHYSAHSLSIGACLLTGHRIGKFDRSEIEAVCEYIEHRFPPRFERPMFLSSSITNRMTDLRDGRIFYSMYDNPTLAVNPALVEEDLQLCAEIGIEYYQVFEGMFDWPDEKKTGATMQRLQKKAKALGVRMGDYANIQGLYCPHFNYEHRSLNHPDWFIADEGGKPTGRECLGCTEYEKILRKNLVAHNCKFGLGMVCFDFLEIQPCYATNHGHEPGDTYQQVLALVHLMEELNALDPNYLIWSNSGNWLELMPKLSWFNQNVYLTDPHPRKYAPHLNSLKFLGDGRREQMVSVHESHFVPYRTFSNCEYYLTPRSRLSDSKTFEYSFLQGLSVTPNICLAELRPFLNRISRKDSERCTEFMKHWLQFIRDNFNEWKHTYRVGDLPGIGAAEIYAHVVNDKGYICLINQNPFPRTANFILDKTIGLNKGQTYILNEIYPHTCPIIEQSFPYAQRGDTITCTMSACSVRFIEIKPSSGVTYPAVYGLPATIKPTGNGYQLVLRSPQGKKVEIGLVLPAGQAVDMITALQTPTVPMYTFPTTVRVLSQTGNLARIEVEFPREQSPRELTVWNISPENIDVALPTADCQGFLGGLVHNAFTEDYEVQLDVRTKVTNPAEVRLPAIPVTPVPYHTLPAGKHTVYTTKFNLPFIERYGFYPGYDDDIVLELAFSNPKDVSKIEASVNGVFVPVQRYANPQCDEFKTFFIELTNNANPGIVDLKLDVFSK